MDTCHKNVTRGKGLVSRKRSWHNIVVDMMQNVIHGRTHETCRHMVGLILKTCMKHVHGKGHDTSPNYLYACFMKFVRVFSWEREREI